MLEPPNLPSSGSDPDNVNAVTAREASDRPASTAARVAEALREELILGTIQPGERLSEEQVREELNCSRSTLREAFQILIRERLLVHHLSRGVFVRELDAADVRDLFTVRRVVGCQALTLVTSVSPAELARLSESLGAGKEARARHDWQRVAAASITVHQTLVDLAHSERLSEIMRNVLGEFRLSYARMTDTGRFHEAFLARNEALVGLVLSGDMTGAARYLLTYLDDSEAELLRLFAIDDERRYAGRRRRRITSLM